jgi:hypothetical protein
MTVCVIIHTTVDDTETHHREIVPKIMRMVARHGGKRIALGHGVQLRVHVGPPSMMPPGRERAINQHTWVRFNYN